MINKIKKSVIIKFKKNLTITSIILGIGVTGGMITNIHADNINANSSTLSSVLTDSSSSVTSVSKIDNTTNVLFNGPAGNVDLSFLKNKQMPLVTSIMNSPSDYLNKTLVVPNIPGWSSCYLDLRSHVSLGKINGIADAINIIPNMNAVPGMKDKGIKYDNNGIVNEKSIADLLAQEKKKGSYAYNPIVVVLNNIHSTNNPDGVHMIDYDINKIDNAAPLSTMTINYKGYEYDYSLYDWYNNMNDLLTKNNILYVDTDRTISNYILGGKGGGVMLMVPKQTEVTPSININGHAGIQNSSSSNSSKLVSSSNSSKFVSSSNSSKLVSSSNSSKLVSSSNSSKLVSSSNGSKFVSSSSNAAQTPLIHTEAKGTNGTKLVLGHGIQTMSDIVYYQGLTPGKKYVISGDFVNQANGQETNLRASKIFTASSTGKGEVKIDFKGNVTKLAGKNIVAFEKAQEVTTKTKANDTQEATNAGKTIATYNKINDKNETLQVTKPKIHTTATVDGAKNIKPNGEVTVTDHVEYSGMVPGVKIDMQGQMHNKDNGQAISDNGNQMFTPDKEQGSVNVHINVNASKMGQKGMVAFEKAIQLNNQSESNKTNYNGQIIATHENLGDEGQSIGRLNSKHVIVPMNKQTPTGKTQTETTKQNIPVGEKHTETSTQKLVKTAEKFVNNNPLVAVTGITLILGLGSSTILRKH